MFCFDSLTSLLMAVWHASIESFCCVGLKQWNCLQCFTFFDFLKWHLLTAPGTQTQLRNWLDLWLEHQCSMSQNPSSTCVRQKPQWLTQKPEFMIAECHCCNCSWLILCYFDLFNDLTPSTAASLHDDPVTLQNTVMVIIYVWNLALQMQVFSSD